MSNYDDYDQKRVTWDHVLDYVPGISTVNSLVDIYQKNAYKGLHTNEAYVDHIQEKSWVRIIGCLLPGVNIICALFCDAYDYIFASKRGSVITDIMQSSQEPSDSFTYNHYSGINLRQRLRVEVTKDNMFSVNDGNVDILIPLADPFIKEISNRNLTEQIQKNPLQYIILTEQMTIRGFKISLLPCFECNLPRDQEGASLSANEGYILYSSTTSKQEIRMPKSFIDAYDKLKREKQNPIVERIITSDNRQIIQLKRGVV